MMTKAGTIRIPRNAFLDVALTVGTGTYCMLSLRCHYTKRSLTHLSYNHANRLTAIVRRSVALTAQHSTAPRPPYTAVVTAATERLVLLVFPTII